MRSEHLLRTNLSGRSDTNVRFHDLRNLLLRLASSSGFADGISSSGSPMSWNEPFCSAMGVMRCLNRFGWYIASS